ncbi:MAG: hypothetical protein HY804_00115 [Nitrospinae bacterium]|nr:hypothetical protein [Nitrospinota bacterium]
MPIDGYTQNRGLIKIAPGSTDNWDVWYNQSLDLLDEPALLYRLTAAEALAQGDAAVILDDGFGAKKAYKAASAAYTSGDPLGVAIESAAAGASVHIATHGRVVNPSWNFGAADKFAYLAADGTVTSAAAATRIGYILSDTAIYLDPAGSGGSGGQTNTVSGSSGVSNTGNNVDAVLAPVYGAAANTVCQGNDARLHSPNTDGGTSAASFEINYAANSARLLTTGLTANRDYTFPDATTKLVGEAAPAAVTGDHDYSAGALRFPVSAGVPAAANDEGDVKFDTVNDDLYLGLGGSAWKKIGASGGAVTETRMAAAEDNLALTAFRLAVVGGLSVQQMEDGVVDEFEDQTGVDAAASINESYDAAGDYYAPAVSTATAASYGEANQNTERIMYSGVRVEVGQALAVPSPITLYSVKFYLRKAGAPTGAVTARIYASAGTVGTNAYPTGAALAVSNAIDASTLTTSMALYEFTFAAPYAMAAGDYAVACAFSGGDAGNAVYAGVDDSAPSHGGNLFRLAPPSTYTTESAVDAVFYLIKQISGDMTLVPNAQSAAAEPAEARLILFAEPVDGVTLNTDLVGYVTKNGGTNWDQLTLADEGPYESGKRIYAASAALTGAGTAMKWKVTTHNNKNVRLHGVAQLWR